MSEQQTWIITFNSDSDDVDYQASTLQEFLLRASFDIKVIQKPKSEHTQGGWVDLVITLVGAGGVTRGLGALAFCFQDALGTLICKILGLFLYGYVWLQGPWVLCCLSSNFFSIT